MASVLFENTGMLPVCDWETMQIRKELPTCHVTVGLVFSYVGHSVILRVIPNIAYTTQDFFGGVGGDEVCTNVYTCVQVHTHLSLSAFTGKLQRGHQVSSSTTLQSPSDRVSHRNWSSPFLARLAIKLQRAVCCVPTLVF